LKEREKGGVTYDGYGSEDDYILRREEVNDDTESKPKVRQSEPSKDESENVVLKVWLMKNGSGIDACTYKCLNVKEKHSNDSVTRFVEPEEIDEGVLKSIRVTTPLLIRMSIQ
jgi:hypothetical protein